MNFKEEKCFFGNRKDGVSGHNLKLKAAYMWMSLACYIRIVGRQVVPNEASTKKTKWLQNSFKESVKHFNEKYTGYTQPCVNYKYIQRIIANMTLGPSYSDEVSKNFQSIILKLSQQVAGDEKLWKYTAD